MPDNKLSRLHARAHLLEYFKLGIRLDGRGHADARKASVDIGSISTAHGSAMVRLGDMSVICTIKGEVAMPGIIDPGKGRIGNKKLPYF